MRQASLLQPCIGLVDGFVNNLPGYRHFAGFPIHFGEHQQPCVSDNPTLLRRGVREIPGAKSNLAQPLAYPKIFPQALEHKFRPSAGTDWWEDSGHPFITTPGCVVYQLLLIALTSLATAPNASTALHKDWSTSGSYPHSI